VRSTCLAARRPILGCSGRATHASPPAFLIEDECGRL
jgi:hypothetical protein